MLPADLPAKVDVLQVPQCSEWMILDDFDAVAL